MSIVAIIVKIMPSGPEVELKGIEEKARAVLEKEGAQNVSFEIKDVAFGLKALMIKFAWPEDKDSSVFEDALSKLEGVSSAVTDDYRRAFG
jgi:translation elongation factor aEF-1 beta